MMSPIYSPILGGTASGGGGPSAFSPLVFSPRFWGVIGSATVKSADVDLASSTANIATLRDHVGSGRALAAPLHSVVPYTIDPNGHAYLAFRQANYNVPNDVPPSMTGDVSFPGGTNAPFTLSVLVRFIQTPVAAGIFTFDGLAQIGGTVGSGSPGALSLATDKTSPGKVMAYPSSGSPAVANFGTETLADSTAGTAVPSWQVLTGTYDGTTLRLYVNGVLAAVSTQAITLIGGNLILGPWFYARMPPDYDLFEVLLCDTCLTSAQVKSYVGYCRDTYRMPLTAAKLISVGDSIEAGYDATTIGVTDFNATLPALFAAAPYSIPFVQYNAAVSGMASYDFLNIFPTGGLGGAAAVTQELAYAYGISPLTVCQVAAYDFVINDLNGAIGGIAVAEARLQVNILAIGQLLRAWGCAVVLGESCLPMDATALNNLAAGFDAQRTIYQTWLRSAVSGTGPCDYMLDFDATASTIPISGIAAWTGSLTVYAARAVVTNDTGKVYFTAAGGIGAVSGGPTGTGTAIADGTVVWIYIASAATIGALVTGIAQARARYVDHVHLGTLGATGDAGSALYGLLKAAVIQIARGMRTW